MAHLLAAAEARHVLQHFGMARRELEHLLHDRHRPRRCERHARERRQRPGRGRLTDLGATVACRPRERSRHAACWARRAVESRPAAAHIVATRVLGEAIGRILSHSGVRGGARTLDAGPAVSRRTTDLKCRYGGYAPAPPGPALSREAARARTSSCRPRRSGRSRARSLRAAPCGCAAASRAPRSRPRRRRRPDGGSGRARCP